ncbi:MAG: polymer-forming cytoskeletal protein [Acidobacteriota bacterium]
MGFKREKSDEIVSILGEGVDFEGEVSFTKGLRVDGTIRGKISAGALLVIGPGGKVEADVKTARASINGEFRGSLRAEDRVEIHRDGKVHGEIYTPCLIIEAGGTFDGRCNMSDHAARQPEAVQSSETVDLRPEPDKL